MLFESVIKLIVFIFMCCSSAVSAFVFRPVAPLARLVNGNAIVRISDISSSSIITARIEPTVRIPRVPSPLDTGGMARVGTPLKDTIEGEEEPDESMTYVFKKVQPMELTKKTTLHKHDVEGVEYFPHFPPYFHFRVTGGGMPSKIPIIREAWFCIRYALDKTFDSLSLGESSSSGSSHNLEEPHEPGTSSYETRPHSANSHAPQYQLGRDRNAYPASPNSLLFSTTEKDWHLTTHGQTTEATGDELEDAELVRRDILLTSSVPRSFLYHQNFDARSIGRGPSVWLPYFPAEDCPRPASDANTAASDANTAAAGTAKMTQRSPSPLHPCVDEITEAAVAQVLHDAMCGRGVRGWATLSGTDDVSIGADAGKDVTGILPESEGSLEQKKSRGSVDEKTAALHARVEVQGEKMARSLTTPVDEATVNKCGTSEKPRATGGCIRFRRWLDSIRQHRRATKSRSGD